MTNFEKELLAVIEQGGSDLYIIPRKDHYQLSAAIKGTVKVLKEVSIEYGQRMISQLKYRADMAVSEHRRPQLGAFKLVVHQQTVNLRLSSVGDYQGRESLVIRFIYQLTASHFSFLIPEQWDCLYDYCFRRGMILFAGPMGAGKTTTMYQLAKRFLPDQVVLTIEDPVEIDEPEFVQLQVNELAGMDYQCLLKLGLRHRPYIFIIGEIRDPQTAAMTIQAALSGHLVLGTIHAQNAYGVLARLQQLGVDKYYLQQVLTAVSYQRLLPLTDGSQAVLCDLLDCQQVAIDKIQKGGMTSEWNQHLNQAKLKGTISSATAAAYRYG